MSWPNHTTKYVFKYSLKMITKYSILSVELTAFL